MPPSLPPDLPQFCVMHPMNISVAEDAWTPAEVKVASSSPRLVLVAQVAKHTEGQGQGEPVFTFHYYQWCAFFFLFQVPTLT